MLIALLIFGLAPVHAQLDPTMAAQIASLTSEGEGTIVTEELLRRGDFPGGKIQRKLALAAAKAETYLDHSVLAANGMGIDGPTCFDAAPKLGLMFRATGLPGYVASCGHHVFMVAETSEATLIIDPTIRQYFGQDLAPSWVPKIFVGTLSELKSLFNRNPGLPVLPYRDIYFSRDWPAYRRDSKMLSRRDRFLYSPMNPEHAPLTEFFNSVKETHDMERIESCGSDSAN